ncbi:sigma-70 family RNA polymerase sigma factor [Defluviitalea saccharophila]|uniref:Sigma-70 family RNA polymerase sigma factor n=1 Tax=Defluviitalea saccharophila TaxID=879970 RepID=A0ABZ2Y2B4_9FIRM|nr:sigma-70 family RNA polymerase sigma factor [Candidatus Epulonipiscium sp.]
MEDYEIIQCCLQGKKEMFEELVSRYKNLVYSIILRMTNDPEEANDLAQEVFIKVYRNLDKYEPTYKFSTWIMRITTNLVIDSRRKQKQSTISVEEMPYEPSSEGGPEEEYLRQEKSNEVIDALNALPEMYRIPIILFHQQGLSYQEISDVINEPLSKVKNRIFRARKMLKEYLLKSKEGGIYGM